ncbi:hypothetical protein MMC26_003376 [Xylographa opegraphella]|nr:hypothetical protein [Xylographa opegraphella]
MSASIDIWERMEVLHLIVYDTVEAYLQQVPGNTAAEVALKIDALLPTNCVGEGEKDLPALFIISVWRVIVTMTMKFSHGHVYQEKLFELIVAIRHLPVDIIKIRSVEVRLWEDMPFLSHNLNFEYDKFDPMIIPFTAEQREWHSLSALAARLTSHDILNYTPDALHALRAALEYKPAAQARPSEYVLYTRLLECQVPVASTWIMECGSIIYTCKEEYKNHASKGCCLWNGPEGFSYERWHLWEQRFHDIGHDRWGSEEMRRIARITAEVMRLVEIEVLTEVGKILGMDGSDDGSEEGSEDEAEQESEFDSDEDYAFDFDFDFDSAVVYVFDFDIDSGSDSEDGSGGDSDDALEMVAYRGGSHA